MNRESVWAIVVGVLVINVGGAWLTACLAPNRPMKHAIGRWV
jgi:hypothetical protein